MIALNRIKTLAVLTFIAFAVLNANTLAIAQTGLRAQSLSNNGQSSTNTTDSPQRDSAQSTDLGKSLFERISQTGQGDADESASSFLLSGPEQWTSRKGLSSSLQILLLLTVLSLSPSFLLMTTCYVRYIVVF